ncbi:MAG TPA: hypothetical protein DCG34_00635 [Clostridiales bacterium]|jgi:hypothetical protein|nr:hypothetical protein [Clostridiales bacterium]
MSAKGKEILEELKSVISGKTLDAILPPLIFVIVNGVFRLEMAVASAIVLSSLLGLVRLFRKQTGLYALGGLAGVLMAAGLAYLTRNPANFFIGAIVSSSLVLAVAVVSLMVGKPMAAWVSHISRGWPLAWFWRKDIKPAYTEVTVFWSVFFLMRLVLQIVLFQRGDSTGLGWVNLLLGWPVTLLVLITSYIYGIWRLNQLKGPGVEEFASGKEPPWKGQTRGF